MREINLTCRTCKRYRASGIWRVTTMHFGNESVHLWPMCAACGFNAVNLRRPMLVNKGKRDEHYAMTRYITTCKLMKSLGTDTVKPEPPERFTYSPALQKLFDSRKERLKQSSFKPTFITDPLPEA